MSVPNIVLGTPIKKNVRVSDQITNQFTKYFGPIYQGLNAAQLKAQIDWATLVRYGRFRMVGDGDTIRTADIIQRDPTARDNSFVRVRFLHGYLFISRY
jgi:carbamate kinase